MKVPYKEAFRIEQITRKIETYSLNFEHAEGKNKAVVFRSKLGITIQNKEVLISALIDNLVTSEAIYTKTTRYGDHYLIDFLLTTRVGRSIIRSAWLVNPEDKYPNLTTAYPIRTKEDIDD